MITLPKTLQSFALSLSAALAMGVSSQAMTATNWSAKFGNTSASQDYTIESGETIIVDNCNINVKNLMLKGSLIINNNLSAKCDKATLGANNIMVHGGLLQIGTASSPYTGKFEITLNGSSSDLKNREIMVMMGGTLDIHGSSRAKVSWTQLDETAMKGQQVLKLARPVNWSAGDKIVLASSSLDPREAEKLTVTAVSGNGKQVAFTPALQYDHFGEAESYDGKTLDMRSEVGLLTRNIVIQGTEASTQDSIGGHIMVMNESPKRREQYDDRKAGLAQEANYVRSQEAQGKIVPKFYRPPYKPETLSVARVEGVELRRMGQMGRKGRYSIHWHMVDNGRGQYIKNSSIHSGFQRAVNVHATDFVLVENNTAYDVVNHMYAWAEDGDEVMNVFKNNLGILQKVPPTFDKLTFFSKTKSGKYFSRQEEHRAGVFWGLNPMNVLVGNRAAGSWQGTGFFYQNSGGVIDGLDAALSAIESGYPEIAQWKAALYKDVYTSNSPYAVKADHELCFAMDNTAHSIFRSDNRPGNPVYPSHSTGWGLFTQRLKPKDMKAVEKDYAGQCTIQGFTAYKTKQGGAWVENATILENNLYADNLHGVFLFDDADVLNTTVIGETSNTTGTVKVVKIEDVPDHGDKEKKDDVEDFSQNEFKGGIVTTTGERNVVKLGNPTNVIRLGMNPHLEGITCTGLDSCIFSPRHSLTNKAITLKDIACDSDAECVRFKKGTARSGDNKGLQRQASGSALDLDGSIRGIANLEIKAQDKELPNKNKITPIIKTNIALDDNAGTPPVVPTPPVTTPPVPDTPDDNGNNQSTLKDLQQQLDALRAEHSAERKRCKAARQAASDKTERRAIKTACRTTLSELSATYKALRAEYKVLKKNR